MSYCDTARAQDGDGFQILAPPHSPEPAMPGGVLLRMGYGGKTCQILTGRANGQNLEPSAQSVSQLELCLPAPNTPEVLCVHKTNFFVNDGQVNWITRSSTDYDGVEARVLEFRAEPAAKR